MTWETEDDVSDHDATEPFVFAAEDHVACVEDWTDGVDIIVL